MLPDSQINFYGDLKKRFLPKYTLVAAADHSTLLNTINMSLTRDVPRVINLLQEEVEYAHDALIGDATKEWKSVSVKDFSVNMMAMLNGKVFLDIPHISRSKEWVSCKILLEAFTKILQLDCTTGYPPDSMAGEQKLKKFPRWTLPLVHHFVPEVTRVKRYREYMRGLLQPLLAARLRDMQDPDFRRPNDIMQVIIDNPNGKGLDVETHVVLQLDLAQAVSPLQNLGSLSFTDLLLSLGHSYQRQPSPSGSSRSRI